MGLSRYTHILWEVIHSLLTYLLVCIIVRLRYEYPVTLSKLIKSLTKKESGCYRGLIVRDGTLSLSRLTVPLHRLFICLGPGEERQIWSEFGRRMCGSFVSLQRKPGLSRNFKTKM